MAAGVHIQEPVLDTLIREDEIEKLVDQASNITLVKIALEGSIGASHTPTEPPDSLETDFEVKDSVKGNEGSAWTLDGEKFLKSPSAAEVYFEENNLAPDACQVTENVEKMPTEHETDGEAKFDAGESNGLEKGLVSALEVAETREVGHGESIPVHEAGFSDDKEDRESTIPEKEATHIESLNVNPEGTKTCDTVHDIETTSSAEEKSMTSTSQEIPGENIKQTTFDTNQETPENISTIVPDEETEQNLSIEVEDSQVKTDDKLEKEDEKPGSTLAPEGQIKNEESTRNELFETKYETETEIQNREEVIEKAVESSPAASEAEDIKASTSDHDSKTCAQNPFEIEVDKSECKPEKETTEEQVEDVSTLSSMTGEDDSLTKDEAFLEKESGKLCFTDASTRDPSHDETTPVDKAKTEDEEEPSKSDSFEDDEDTESTILVEELNIEKHLESLSAVPNDIKACDLVQDTEAKSSIKEELPTATPQEIWGDKLEQIALHTNEEKPEDISSNASNEENEQDSIVEVPFVAEALTTDNELAITEGNIKVEDQREKDLLENNNGTESELLKQEVTEDIVELLQLANEAEETKVSTPDQNTKVGVLENQISTENALEIEIGKSECKPEKETPEEQVEEVSTLSSVTGEDDSLTKDEAHSETESEKPCFADDETMPVDKVKAEDEEPSKSDLFDNMEDTESKILVEEPIKEKHLESSSAAPGDIKACNLVQDTETKSSIKEKLPTATSREIWVDKIEQTAFDTKEETPEDISTNVSNEENEQDSIVEVPFVAEASTTDNELAITEGKIKDEDQRENDLLEKNNDTESELLRQEATEKPVESLQLANEAEDTKVSTSDHDTEISVLDNQIPTENAQEIVADETESKPCDVVDTKKETLDIQDVSTIESDHDSEENSLIEEDDSEKPLLREGPTRDTAGDESTYTHEDKNEGEGQRRAELFENPNSLESMSLIEDNTIPKLVESPQVDAEDIKTHVFDQDAETTGLILPSDWKSNDAESAVKYEVKTEDYDRKEDQLCDIEKNPVSNVLLEATQIETPIESLQETLPSTVPQGFLDDKTEEKTVDAIQKEKEIQDVQHDVATIVSNDDHEETSVIGEDDSQMTNEENLGEEIKKSSSIEASRTDTSGDKSTNKHEVKSEGEEQMKAELFEDKEDTESTSLKEEKTAAQPLESPQVDVEDIKTYVSDQGMETTGPVEVFEGVANNDEPEVEDQKQVELCDSENIPDNALLLQAAHVEKPFESSKEALPTSVPQGFLDENIEENATTTVLKENIEDHSLLQVDGSQTQCKDYLEEESEITSIVEASTKHNNDNSVNVHEDSSEHEDLRKHEFGDTKITSQEEEEQVETPAKSSNIASEDILASDSCQETEITSSQGERTLNEEETGCEQIEVETLDTADTKMHTSEAQQDVSTIVPNDDNGENSATEKSDLQMENEETFGKETAKPYVTEASTTDASGDDSANKCEDKVEGKQETGAELFEAKKDMESKLLKEEDIMVRLVESPQVYTEDIKLYVSGEGAETTGIVEASEGDPDNDESAVKIEVKSEDNDKKEDELSDNEKNPESDELLEAAQTEKPIESLQETLPSTVPQGFLDDNTEEITADALQKDEDMQNSRVTGDEFILQNFTTTVPNEKIEENSLIEMDSSQIEHEEYLEKEHEIPSVIEALTKHANDDELIVCEDNIEHEDPRKLEFESEKDAEINLQEDDTQIETHIKSSQVDAEDRASDSNQGTETIDSQEERGLNEDEIVHAEKEVERLDAIDSKKETPERLDVSTFVLNDDNKENLVIGDDDLEMKNEENLGKESENPSSIEASPMDASRDEPIKKCEDKIEGEEHVRPYDTGCTFFREVETAAQPLESPQVDAEDIKTYVSDQGTETTCQLEVFEEAANDNQPEVKCTIKTEDRDQKEDELCDNEKIPDSTLLLEVAEIEKPFESLKEALPTSVPRGFLDEKREEKIIDATEKDEESCEIQNVTTIGSNENIEEDDSLIQVNGSQMQCKECSEKENERTPITEASTKNVNDVDSINVQEDITEHEDLRKDELVETKEDIKTIPQKEEAQVETAVKSLQIDAKDFIESDSCQETATMSSQKDQMLNEEEIVREQIEVETLDTADTKIKTPEAQAAVPNDESEANSTTGESDLQMGNEENLGKESGKQFVIEASVMDASGEESTNKCEDRVEGEEQMGAEMFIDKKYTESTLLKEQEIMVKLVESPHVDTEKTLVSDEGAETTGVLEALEGDADEDKSAVKYDVKTEDNDQNEDKLCDNVENPESGVLLKAAQTEFSQETLPSTVPREFLEDETEENTKDAVEKDKDILDIQNVAKSVSNEKIEDKSLIQADASQIQHEKYLEKEIEIPSVIEASTKDADDDELISTHENIIEHKDLKNLELIESEKDGEINLQKDEAHLETSVKSLQVAAEDIVASDSYHGAETTSQEEQLVNDNEIVHEQIEAERLDTTDSDKETLEAQKFAIILSSDNIKENSQILEDGSEQKHEELLEKESKPPPFSETLTVEANDGVPDVIHQDKVENEKLEKVDKFECDKHEEIILLKEASAEKLNESSKEDLEDIKNFVSGANTAERSLIEEQSLNEIHDHIQNVAKSVSNEKIEDNSLIQADASQIQHEKYLEKEIEIPSVIEASTKDADDDELISTHENIIEHKDLKNLELLESEKDGEINLQKDEAHLETSVKSLQVAAEDIIAPDSYHGAETTSQEEQLINDNEIVHEQIEAERLDTTDSDKETLEAQNFAIILSSDNMKENSQIPEGGSEQKHEDLLEKESKPPPFSETLTMEANDEVPDVIHKNKVENEKLEKVHKFESDKHEEIILLKEASAEKLNESSKEDLEVKNFVSVANTTERSLIEVQSLNENHDLMDENIVDKDPEEIEDEHLDKDVMFENEEHTEIDFKKEEEPVEKLQETQKKDLEEIKASVSHEGTETISSLEERDLTEISQESVGDPSEDKILTKAQEIPDFTPIVPGEPAEKNSSTHPDASQMKHEELSEKVFETLSTPETPFLYSSSNEPMTIDVENIVHEHSNKVDKFEDEKHTKIAMINDQAPVEGLQEFSRRDLEEVKAFVSWEGAETSSTEERGYTEISPEIVGDKLEDKLLDRVGTTREFTKFDSDENGEDISQMLVDESQVKHEKLFEKKSEASPLSETSSPNFNFNQDKIEDGLLNRVDKFESEKHAEISLIKEEAPLELNETSLEKDLEEIKAFDLSEDTETSTTGERNLTAIPQENEFTTIDASQIKHELPERDSKTPPFPLLYSSNGKSAVVHTGKIEDQVLEKADKFECMESGEATLLNKEALAVKLAESSKDLEGIKESITGDETEITSSTEEQNIITISQETVDDQVLEKVLDVVGEASDATTIIPDNNTERNLLVEVEASQMKHEEHLEKESEIPSLLMLNTSSEEPTTVYDNKAMEPAEIILSNEEALENSSKEENENIRPSVLCEDTETSSKEQESLITDSHEIVGDQVKEKIIDIAQHAPDLTPITSDENAEENSLYPLDGSQIKHGEPLEKESVTPSVSMLDTMNEESAILQGRIIDDQDLREVDKLECEKDTEATLLKESTPAEKVTESVKDDLKDTKVSLSREDKEVTCSIEEQSQNANRQVVVVDQTQENILDSATKAQDFKHTVSHENAGEDSLTQVDESQVKQEIASDQTHENALDTAPKEQDFEPAISHENAEANSLVQVDEIQMKHGELEKESETTSLLIVDTSNEESRIIYEDITEDENLKKNHHFECKKHEEITSTEQETQVTKVNESSKEDLEDSKALASGEDSETTSFEEKESLKENPQEILSDQQEEKILDIAPEAQNFIKVDSNKNVKKDSMIEEDGSQVREEILEKEGETLSLSGALILNTTSEDSIVIHENKIETEDTREVDTFECEKHVDGKILDAAPEAPESKIIVLDENTEEISSNQVEKSQTKHEELLEKESKTLSMSETSLLNTSNEDSTTINDDKVEDEGAENVDELGCEKHTELPLTKEEEPAQILYNPLKRDIEEIKSLDSCLDTETTSSIEDRNLQINPRELLGDQMEENIIDTTPEPQKFTALVSDENTKENSSLDVDESQIKHEELLENESEKPLLLILKTSNEESSCIRDGKTENEDVRRDEKVEQLNDFPKEGQKNIEVSVPGENLETTSPMEERSLTENPQEKLTKDKMLDVVPEALELKTVATDKNIEEKSFIPEDGSQMKHEEYSEKECEKPSLTETSMLNTRNEEPTIFLDDKIEDEDQAKDNKSECEKHSEITEVQVENPNSSNLENIATLVSCEDTEPTNSTEEKSLTVNPIENVDGQKTEKVLDKALEAPDFTSIVPDENKDDNPSIRVDGSQMKHEELLEKERKVPSLLNTNNEELETIHNDKIVDEALKNVDEFESKKCSEVNKLKEEAQVEESMAYKDIKAYVSYQGTEASALQEQILTANPQDISEDNLIDTADSKEKIIENLPVSNVNVLKDSLIKIDESESKHEEILEKEPYLAKTSTVEFNDESTTVHKDTIEEESGKVTENTLLNEGSPAYESVESLQVVSEDIKASVSCQKMDTACSNLNADPQEIAGDQTDDKINTAGTREITLEALNLTTVASHENEVLDSITPQDGLEIELKEISMLADNDESIIIHEDTIDLKKVDTFKSVQQTENTSSKEEAHEDESMDSLQVVSEPIKASELCQDRVPTSSSEEKVITTTPQIVGDQVEEDVTDTAKTWEETPEVSSSIFVFQEDEANGIGADDINSVMVKDEETLNRDTASDEICSSDKVQAEEEEKEIISKTKIDERAEEDDIWVKLPEDETHKTYIEVKEINFPSHAEDTSEITQHDGAKDVPKGNENSTAKTEFLEDGCSNGSTESITSLVRADVEQIDKDIKAETVITETGAAFSALPITGVQCGPEENESEDGKAKETETSLAPEGQEYQGQHAKLHESPSLPLSHIKDSEWEMAEKRGIENLQSGDDKNDDMKELDEGSVVISNERNFPETNSNENIEADVTAGEKEASAIQQVSEFVVQEIQEQPGKTVEAVTEEKGIKSEQGEMKYDGSDDLNINSSTMETDKIAPSDILCSSTSDAGQNAVSKETQILVQEKEQKPGKGKAVEAVQEEKEINTEEDEIKEHDFNVLKENLSIVALDKATPVNILQGSTIDAGLRATGEETPEQHGLDEASLKETEGGPASITDKLTVLKADQINNVSFDSPVGSNKVSVLQHEDSSESSQTEREKQKTSEPEKGENCENEETAKPMNSSESTKMDKPSQLGLIQEPVKEVSKILDHLIDKKQPTIQEEELQAEKSAEVEHVRAKTNKEKDGDGESGEHQISDLISDNPVMVYAANKDVKVAHKKSHNILSGVGSKVKHSISKVKKAITGKSSHPKSASPKYTEKK